MRTSRKDTLNEFETAIKMAPRIVQPKDEVELKVLVVTPSHPDPYPPERDIKVVARRVYEVRSIFIRYLLTPHPRLYEEVNI